MCFVIIAKPGFCVNPIKLVKADMYGILNAAVELSLAAHEMYEH